MAKRVETEEEGRALIGTGGRWGQGYAISSPAFAGECSRLDRELDFLSFVE